MSAVDACVLRFAYEFVVEFFLVRVAEIVVVVAYSRVVADVRRENVTPSAIDADDKRQFYLHLYSDKFDHDNLIEPMMDAAVMRPPFEPQQFVLADYLSYLCGQSWMPTIDTEDNFGRQVIAMDGNHGAEVSVPLFVALEPSENWLVAVLATSCYPL